MVESLKDEYSSLKRSICSLAFKQAFSLQEVKDFYKASINSNRFVSRVSNLGDIFSLLEERSLLSERNVTALHYLGQVLNNSEIINTVQVYSKCILNSCVATCNICSLPCSYEEFLASSPHVEQNLVSGYNDNKSSNNNKNSNYDLDELGEAFKNISLRIGRNWKILARHLDIDEGTIDEICNNYPNNHTAQALVALKYWQSKGNASIPILDSALEKRYCKRKGLGIHLRKPIISPLEVICLSS